MKLLKTSKGFSMVELLVVITIIGILGSIAIMQYSSYRQRAYNGRAMSDIRNTLGAQEAYFASNETFVDSLASLPGFDNASPAVTVLIESNDQSWSGSTYHPQGTLTYCYDSSNGQGIIEVEGTNQPCP